MKALVVREPWIDLILDGRKTWELRTQATSIRGTIALIRKGTGRIEGVVDLVDCLNALRPEDLAGSEDLHGVPASRQVEVAANGWLTPWVLVDARRLAAPVPYTHPQGAVVWVDLEPATATALARSRPAPRGPIASVPSEPAPTVAAAPIPASAEPIAVPPRKSAGKVPQISPKLEVLLVRAGEDAGFTIKPLASQQTKMRELSVRCGGDARLVFIDRMPASEPQFRIFLEPRIDERAAARVAAIPGVERFRNRSTGDYRFRHSAFRAFAPHDPVAGEPAAHGWFVEAHRAHEAFPAILAAVAAA